MKKVSIHQMKVYGFHGCLPEEAKIGTQYQIDIDVEFDFEKASLSDNLEETVDYVIITKIVQDEMAIRAKLIEHVVKRIHNGIKKAYPNSGHITVKLSKYNPPAGAELHSVSVTISE